MSHFTVRVCRATAHSPAFQADRVPRAAQGLEFVQVMNLPIKEIRNMDACRNLRQLHITDCRLERISGLEYNTELRELYLCVTMQGFPVHTLG